MSQKIQKKICGSLPNKKKEMKMKTDILFDCQPIKRFYKGKGRFAYHECYGYRSHDGIYYSKKAWEHILRAVFKLKNGDSIYNYFTGKQDKVKNIWFERFKIGKKGKSWYIEDFYIETESRYFLCHYPYKNSRDYDEAIQDYYDPCLKAARKLLTNKVYGRRLLTLNDN
jgi:hypothetical protein